jgi:phosphoribosyl 1,2-cyclic phosphodiesterase
MKKKMMINKPFIELLLVSVLFTVSCSFYSKDNYLADFEEFVTEIENNCDGYSEKDWDLMDSHYQNYAETYYEQFKTEMTKNDEITIVKLKARYQAEKIKYKTGKMIEKVNEGLNEMKTFIEDISK